MKTAKFAALWIALGSLCASPAVLGRETDAEWKQHQAEFNKAMASESVAEMERAVLSLARADRPEAADLLFKILDWENPRLNKLLGEREKITKQMEAILAAAKNQGGQVSQSEFDRYKSLEAEANKLNEQIATESFLNNAAIEALSAMREEDAISRMIDKGLKDRSWRVRAGVAQALGEIKPDAAAAPLIGLVSDRDPKVQTVAMDALAKMKRPEAAEAIEKNLGDKNWQVRVTAARALGKLGQSRSIKPLVDQMQKEEGRTLEDFDAALKDMTGHTTHGNPRAWQSWYNANQNRLDEILSKREESSEGDVEVGKTITFYGITTKSKRIIFIIDISGSMTEPAGHIPSAASTGGNSPIGQLPANPTRIDVAKYELKNAVGGLPDDAKFNIIYFNHRVDLFKPNSMLSADKTTKQRTYAWIDGLVAEGMTNIYDSLVQAMELAGRGASDANYKIGVDTIFFLTDGTPTAGTIQDPNKILEDITQRNTLRKIKIHVIGIGAAGQGDQGIDTAFLKKLAEDNDGQFVQR